MDTKSPKERLMVALRKGKGDRVVALINQFPDELEVDMSADSADNRILHRAARFGHASVVSALLEKGAQPNCTNKFGMTPLHHAAVQGDMLVIRALVKGGCNVNQADQAGRLPLHWAATKGHVEGSKELLEGGAKAAEPDKEGFTPLHRCAQEEPVEKKDKDEEEGVVEDKRRDQQRRKGEVAAELIRRGARVDSTELKGLQTPLHLAAMNGLDMVGRVLIDGGADVNIKNKIGQTPLIYSCIEQHLNMATLLLQSGANPSLGNPLHWDWAPLHWAALSDNVQLVQLILEGGGRNVADKSGRIPAVLAAEHGKMKVVDILQNIPAR